MTRCFRIINELEADGVDFISSHELGELLGCTPSQVRQDLSFFGKYGLSGFGYAVGLLHHDLVHVFGADRHFPAILVGVGNIGRELLENDVLQGCGYELLAAFDSSPAIIGREINGFTVRDAAELEEFLRETPTDAAALCVPEEAVGETAELLCGNGVRAIWNVSGGEMKLPWGTVREDLRLSDSLLSLGYRVKESLTRREAVGE